MTSKLKLLVASAFSTAVILGVNPAYAADLGTDAGTSITNNVSVAYNVASTAQTAETDSDTFVVDREVNLVVTKSDAVNTLVAPGATQQALTYTVSNQTNDTIDVLLTNENLGGDDFNTTGAVTYYLDDGDGVFDASDDTLITSVNDLDEDETATVHLVTNIPIGDVTGDLANVALIGQAADSTTGVAFVNNSGDADDPTLVQNVFADGTGTHTGAGAADGFHSDTDTFEIFAADVTVVKSSRVVSDPLGSANPKAIPGAVIEYCISVANATGSAPATGIVITDTLPADVGGNGITFVASSILENATVTSPGASQTCSGGAAGGSFTDPVVTGNLSDITAGNASALIFRVTVD